MTVGSPECRSQGTLAQDDAAASEHAQPEVLLDETAFPGFRELIEASKDYARYSGCRFRSSSFDGLSENSLPDQASGPRVVGAQRSKDRGPVLAAKLRAVPAVFEFMRRLRAGEPELLEELDQAYHIVMEESVRNSMVAAFKRLGQWPPSPSPEGVPDDDCNYQDVSAPLDVLAQRTYNDAIRRTSDEDGGTRWTRRAMTAAFLVDFAHEAGTELPPMPEDMIQRFERFADRVAHLEGNEHATSWPDKDSKACRSFEDRCREFLGEFPQKPDSKTVALAAVGALTVGPVATAGLLIARRAWQRRGQASTNEASQEGQTHQDAELPHPFSST